MATDLFWNGGARDTIQGVDLLGVRHVDQELERVRVAGVTTLSGRARYLSLLSWTIAEYYHRVLRAGGGSSAFDWHAFGQVVGRLEFITLAATMLGGADDSAVLGKINLRTKLEQLRDGRAVAPGDEEAFTLLNVYLGPCRGFGLLHDAPSSERPIQVPPPGQAVHKARAAATRGSRLAEAVFTGDPVERDDFAREGHLFDLNGLMHGSAAEERDQLIQAFQRPPDFRETLAWIFRSLADAPQSPWELPKHNYEQHVAGTASPGHVETAFFEHELRRRVHFALELLLCATARTLAALEEADLPAIISEWERATIPPSEAELAKAVGVDTWNFADPLATFAKRAGQRSFDGAWISPLACREMKADQQALYALALLVACERQSRAPRSAGRFPDRRSAMEQVFARLDASAGRPLPEVLAELVREQVVGRHLDVTLGKMGRGQGCSLRFYPEGALLRPLVTDVRAGFSGLRLPNVFAMLADIGLLARDDQHQYGVTADGGRVHTELQA